MAATKFALGTFAPAAGPSWAGMVLGERVVPLSGVLGSSVTVRGLVDDWDAALPRLQAVADRPPAESVPLDGLRAAAPVQPIGQVFQAGANYRTHVLDLLEAAERRGDSSDGLHAGARDAARAQLDERTRTGRPFVFSGSSHAMTGPTDEVQLPAGSQQHDWELELALVIGRRARHVPRERALDAVAGYLICNDVTTRDALVSPGSSSLGLDWLSAKNAPTFLPTGPYLVPAVHAGDPMDLRITLRVNGRTMQDETTADMLFDVASILEHLARVTELRPGDLVLTGSPAGNGASHGIFLKPGDVMEGAITGLGAQRNVCVPEPVEAVG